MKNTYEQKIEFIEPNREFGLIEENDFTRIDRDGGETNHTDCMLTENMVSVHINGQWAGNVPCTPQYITELVIGWMNSEGFIDSLSKIKRIEISEDGTAADVTLVDTSISPLSTPRIPIKPVTPILWRKEWIFNLVEDFEVPLPLRELTRAAHNCRLARGDEVLFRCEDIGRHTAIDKVVGWAMRNGVDTSDCVLFTSGRISQTMALKVIRAGIPVMTGKGTISRKAVQLAKANDLTLIGYSKKDSISVFADAAR